MSSPDFFEIDPETGVSKLLVEQIEQFCPCVKQRDCRFRVAMLCFDGSVSDWVIDADEKGINGYDGAELTIEEIPEIPLHSRSDAVRIMGTMYGLGYIPRAFPEDEDLSDLIAFTASARRAKTGREQCELIAKHSVVILGQTVTADEVWNSLPKELGFLKLGEWYGRAVALENGATA